MGLLCIIIGECANMDAHSTQSKMCVLYMIKNKVSECELGLSNITLKDNFEDSDFKCK